MRWYVYILYSKTLKRFYTGFSQFRFKRQRQHRRGESFWTSQVDDWEEVYCEVVESTNEARAMEKRIKARGAARFLADQGRPFPRP